LPEIKLWRKISAYRAKQKT